MLRHQTYAFSASDCGDIKHKWFVIRKEYGFIAVETTGCMCSFIDESFVSDTRRVVCLQTGKPMRDFKIVEIVWKLFSSEQEARIERRWIQVKDVRVIVMIRFEPVSTVLR